MIMYPDFEALILDRQEQWELEEDSDDFEDDCSKCDLLSACRNAAEGRGEFPNCPFQYKEGD